MGNRASSPTDETGSNNIIINARKMEDFAVETTRTGIPDHWKKNRGSFNIMRHNQFIVTKPILITANDTIRMWGDFNGDGQFFYVQNDEPLFFTLPLNEGDIDSITDSGGFAEITTSAAHNLKINDTVKIIDSQNAEYNGNFTVTAVGTATTFTIDAVYTTNDTTSSFKQTEVYIESTTDGGGGTVNIKMTAHPFEVDDWINVTDTTDIDGDYQITATTVDTVTVAATFTATTTGNVNTAANTVNFLFERFNVGSIGNAAGAPMFDLQGRNNFTNFTAERTLFTKRNLLTGGVSTESFLTMGEVRDFLSVGFVSQCAFFNASGFKDLGSDSVFATNFFVFNSASQTTTNAFQPIFDVANNSSNSFVTSNSQYNLLSNQSLINIPQGVTSDYRANISFVVPAPSPGDYFSLGKNNKGTTAPAPVGGDDTRSLITIDDVSEYRGGNTASFSQTSHYNFYKDITINNVDPAANDFEAQIDWPVSHVFNSIDGISDNGNGTLIVQIAAGLIDYFVGDTLIPSGTGNAGYDGLGFEIIQQNASDVIVNGTFAGIVGAVGTANVWHSLTETASVLTDNGDGTLDVTVADGTGFLPGDYVELSGFTPSAYDDVYELVSKTGNVLTISGDSQGTVTVFGTVQADARPLVTNTTLASLNQEDPKIKSVSNTDLANSISTGEFSFVNTASPVTVTISATDTPVAIGGGAWTTSNLSRIDADVGNNGIATINTLGTNRFEIGFSALFEKLTGGTTDIGVTVLVNGIEAAVNPPHSVNAGIVQVSTSELFTLSEGDTVQLAVVNYGNIDNIQVSQANMTIIGEGGK